MNPTPQTDLNDAAPVTASIESTTAIERVRAALSCLRAGQPICIHAGNGCTSDGWLVAGADSHLRLSAKLLLRHGQGPLFFVRSGEDGARVESSRIGFRLPKSLSAHPIRPWMRWSLWRGSSGESWRGVAGSEVPDWLQCISPQPGGILHHASVTEASYALACSIASRMCCSVALPATRPRRAASRSSIFLPSWNTSARSIGRYLFVYPWPLEFQRATVNSEWRYSQSLGQGWTIAH